MKQRVAQLADSFFPRVVELRRQLHANPELSWNEFQTAKLVADELRKLNIEVREGVAETGVVGVLRCKKADSRCIALRADMDALPIHEDSKQDYCSRNVGVMHACGHDVHTSNLLGVAMILAELRDDVEGTFKFIFQPSEERIPSGAEAMIAAGVLENPSPQKIFGLHVTPELEVGTIGFSAGKFMASCDEIYLTIVGKGGHAARPDLVVNPILIAAEILLELRLLSNPQIPVVLSFGKIEGKGATNVVPDRVQLAGTLRCFDESLRMQLHRQIEVTAQSIAENYLASCEVSILKGYPVLINDAPTTMLAQRQAETFIGITNVVSMAPRMGSEDFAYYTHQIPACFFRLGTGNRRKGILSGLHTPTFDVDEESLRTGMSSMSWVALYA